MYNVEIVEMYDSLKKKHYCNSNIQKISVHLKIVTLRSAVQQYRVSIYNNYV